MDEFAISSHILGSDKHIVVSREGFSTVSKLDPNVWTFSGEFTNTGNPCLDSALKLAGLEISARPPEKWVKAMSTLTDRKDIPWSSLMPSVQYKAFVKKLVKSIVEAMDKLPEDYYKAAWAPSGELLAALRPAKVDGVAYRAAQAAVGHDSGALETFKPGPGGFLPAPVYDRFGTRTGRLTVSSGPNILTLKKEYRKLLRSFYPDGSIVSLDFSALEARIILYEAGRVVGSDDIYESISKSLFAGECSRDVMKVAVLSELYGSSKASLGARLHLAGRQLDDFVDKVRSYFKIADLRKRLKDQYSQFGKLFNKFGRPLELDDPQDHLLVNTYTQSTGVDVSLLGFKSIIDKLGTDGVRPLFVLHDALILDVRGDRLKDVESIKQVDVLGYRQSFSLKADFL